MNKSNQLRDGITNLSLLSQRLLAQPIGTSFTKSLPQLKYLIEKDNLKFHYPLPVVQRCSYYLSQRGVTLVNLQESLKDVKNKVDTANADKNHSNCYFYVKNLSLDNISELVQKVHEYSVFNNIQMIMSDYQQPSAKSLYANDKQKVKVFESSRDEQKFKQYNDKVSEFVSRNIDGIIMGPMQLLRCFYQIKRNEFWALIVKMFDGVSFQDSELVIKQELIRNSLRILQEEFAQKLPFRDIMSLEMFVKGELIDKLVYGKNYVYFDNKGRPIWALVYLLLRAGRLSEIRQLLPATGETRFMSDFNSYIKHENRGYKMNQEVKDVFFEAIYSIFNRKPECAYQILMSEKDYLWFALKTVSLTNTSDSSVYSLNQLQDEMAKRFDLNPTRDNFINLILVLGFDKIIEPNSFFDSDDIGHFMLFLYILRLDQAGFLNQNTREQFCQKMVSYAQELIRTNLTTALDYVILCYNKISNPNSSILAMISDLLIYTNSVERYFGDPPAEDTYIQLRIKKALLPTQEEYEAFIFKTMDAYLGRSKNYLYPARVYEEVLKNTNRSIQYLLGILVRDIVGETVLDQLEINDTLKLIKQIQNQKNINSRYIRLIEFIQLTKDVKDMVKFDREIDRRVFLNKYFPNKPGFSTDCQQILHELSIAKYLGVYAVFVFYSLKLIEKYYSFKHNEARERIESINNFRKHCKYLKQNGISKEGGLFFKQKMTEVERQLELIRQ